MAFCAKCGASLPEGANFCSSCGTTVGADLPSVGPLSSNIAALLSYVLGFITGIIFLMLEPYKNDKFVRFHASQSIGLSVALVAVSIALSILGATLGILTGGLGSLILVIPSALINLGFLVLWVFCMIKAYSNEMFRVPVIGDIVARMSA